MSTSLEETIARLELTRARFKQQEIDKKIERLNVLIGNIKTEIEVEMKILETVRLTSQLAEFVQLNEQYAETLQLASGHARDDIPTMKALQDAIDMKEARSKAAIKLFSGLMRDKIAK